METRLENEELRIPDVLPLLPVRDVVVYPYMILPLFVGREISIAAVDHALSKDRLIFLATQRDVSDEDPAPDAIYTVGTVAMIMRMLKLPDGRVKILVQGLSKGRVVEYEGLKPFYSVRIERIVVSLGLPQQVGVRLAYRAQLRRAGVACSERSALAFNHPARADHLEGP